MRENRLTMGTSQDMSGMRQDALLRWFTEPPRLQARANEQSSGDCFGWTRGALVVLLSGWGVCRVL